MYKVILHNQSAEFEASYPTEESRTLWNDEVADDRILLNPQVKDSMVEIPTFTFTILPNHPLYGQIRKFKSIITVYCGSRVMFFGRVIGDGNDFYGQKNVSCEGAMSFFIDSVQDPMKETSKTPTEMLNQIVTAHNQQMASEPFKLMTVGTITIDDALASKKFKIEGYSQTKGVLEGSMTNDYKGYFRIRRENNTTYIDWLKDFNRVNAQPVKMEVNMLDRTNEEEADEYYTVLLPVGSNNRTLTNKYLEDADGIAEYGRIIKPMSFSDAKTQEKLLEEAQKEFAKRGTHIPRSIHVKAVDMHLLGENVDEILCGDKMTNVEDRTGAYFEDLTVVEVTYDLLNLANDEYILENQEALDKRRSSGNGSLSSRAARTDGGLDENTRNLIKHYDNITLDVENVYSLTADIIREQARLYEVTAKTFHAFIDEGYVDSYSPAYIQTVTVDGQEYHVQGFSGTTSHQDTSGTGSWVQEITGVVVEQQYPRGKENSPTFDPTVSYMVGDYVFYTPEGGNKGLYKFVLPHQGPWNDVHVQVVTKEWLPVYKKDANGDDVYDLITGEAIYQTLDEMRENQVHVPLRSIAQQTQTEFYQIVGTTDISTVLHYPSESSGAGEFSPTTQYAVNDYVYCKVDTHNNFDQNGVKTLFKFINPHQGAWNKADVVEVTKITIQDMTGSNLWQDEDHIVAVVGTMEVVDTVPTGAAESPAFSSSASYLAGDMVWYPDKTSTSKKLYKFKVDHQGAWNASHVTQITTKSVQIVEGSGLSVYQDGVSVGLFKDGVMNAGMLVGSLNAQYSDIVGIPFSESKQYAVNDYVTYNGKVYRCTTAHQGAWNASHFTEASGKVAKLKADIVDLGEYATVGELNAKYVKTENLQATIAGLEMVEVATLFPEGIDIAGGYIDIEDGGALYINDSHLYIDGTDINNALYAVQIAGPTNNVYTLQAQTIANAGTENWNNAGTFSRAVSSFTPTWNGSTYQVTANPQNQPYSQTFALVLTGQPPASSFSAIFGEAASGGQGAVATTRISKTGYLHEFTDSGTKYVGVFTAYNSSNQTYSGEIARIQVTGSKGTVTAITSTSIGAGVTKATGITLDVAGTNINDFAGDSTFELFVGTYTTNNVETPCTVLKHGSDIIGRVNCRSIFNNGHDSVAGDEIILSATKGSGIGTTSSQAPSDQVTKADGKFSGYVWEKLSDNTYKNLRAFSMSMPSSGTWTFQQQTATTWTINFTVVGKKYTTTHSF